MEKSSMFMCVNPDIVEVEIIQAAIPVLLAWIHPDADRQPYQELLEYVAATFPNQVQVYLLQKDTSDVLGKRYGINGTPTFLLIQAGRVTQRLLGEVDSLTLSAFIAQNVGKTQQAST